MNDRWWPPPPPCSLSLYPPCSLSLYPPKPATQQVKIIAASVDARLTKSGCFVLQSQRLAEQFSSVKQIKRVLQTLFVLKDNKGKVFLFFRDSVSGDVHSLQRPRVLEQLVKHLLVNLNIYLVRKDVGEKKNKSCSQL